MLVNEIITEALSDEQLEMLRSLRNKKPTVTVKRKRQLDLPSAPVSSLAQIVPSNVDASQPKVRRISDKPTPAAEPQKLSKAEQRRQENARLLAANAKIDAHHKASVEIEKKIEKLLPKAQELARKNYTQLPVDFYTVDRNAHHANTKIPMSTRYENVEREYQKKLDRLIDYIKHPLKYRF